MSQTQAQQVKQSLDEVQSLRQRLGTPHWRAEDWGLVEGILASYERMLTVLLEAQISLKRLGTLLFGKRHRGKSLGWGGLQPVRACARTIEVMMRAVLVRRPRVSIPRMNRVMGPRKTT